MGDRQLRLRADLCSGAPARTELSTAARHDARIERPAIEIEVMCVLGLHERTPMMCSSDPAPFSCPPCSLMNTLSPLQLGTVGGGRY